MDLRKTLFLLPMFLSAAVLSFSARAEAAKPQEPVLIGYVNLQRAILEVEEGKRAKASLKATFDQKQKKLNERETDLVKMRDQLKAESQSGKDDAATRQRLLDFQNKLVELQQVFMKEQQELQEQEQKQLAGITQKMRQVIEEIGKAGAYTLILEVQESRLLYAKTYLDLTNEVIRKYNAKYK